MAFSMLDPSFMEMLAAPSVDPFSLLFESEQPSLLGEPFDCDAVGQYLHLASLDFLPDAAHIDDDQWDPLVAMESLNEVHSLPLDPSTTAALQDADCNTIEDEMEDEDEAYQDDDKDGSDYCPSEEEMDTAVPPDDDDDDAIDLDDDSHVPFLFNDGTSSALGIIDLT